MQKYKTVEEFLADQSPEKLEQINAIRDLILKTDLNLEENVKWNAPNYVLAGQDRITFNLMNKGGKVKLVLHMGASKKEDKKAAPVLADDGGLVHWSSDIRGTISFENLTDIHEKATKLTNVIHAWLAIRV